MAIFLGGPSEALHGPVYMLHTSCTTRVHTDSLLGSSLLALSWKALGAESQNAKWNMKRKT